MNTLMLLGVYVLFSLVYGADRVREWPRASRPRGLLTLNIVYAAALFVVSGPFFAYLLTHPAEIQSVQAVAAEGGMGWALYASVVLFILSLLLRVSEALRSLTRRLSHWS